MKIVTIAALGMLLSAATTGATQAAVFIYADDAAFASAAGPLVTEDFSDASLAEGLSFDTSLGTITSGGKFRDTVMDSGEATTFRFDAPIYAVGGRFDTRLRGVGPGLRFTLIYADNSEETISEKFWSRDPGFFGFRSDTGFSGFRVETADSRYGWRESYLLDDLSFSPLAVVPEPGAWGLMVLGFMSVGAALRTRRVALIRA